MIEPGQSIGNYRILSKIGTGGMGAVYLAEHPLIGKKVALKVIHRELAHNRDVVQRFFQEAKAVNSIGNEHIVEIHDFGVTPEHDHFYIMEYLDGQTLAGVMSREPVMGVMRALHIGAQIASALAAAHASGVIHRDLKPDNIMLIPKLGDPDFVKVLDFGLAKVFAADSAVKTAAGVLLGTPQYMSPEACESKRDIDHRTDVYALGILLFQMMTGKLPFDGQSMGEVLVKQVTALPPAPRALNPSIPPSVEQILLRCLAKPVDARFQTMIALRQALLAPDTYLGSAPPIQPARSLAPGEMGFDAKAVMAHADAAAKNQRTVLGMSNVLPAGPRAHRDSQQPTMIADPGANPRVSTAMPVMPGMIGPAEPRMNTMRIATPLGYSSRPPRRVWPIVLALGLMLGLGGGAVAVVWFGGERAAASPIVDSGAGAGPPLDASGIAPVIRDAAPAPPSGSGGSGNKPAPNGSATGLGSATGPGKPSATPQTKKLARLTIDSIPAGADVFTGGKRLGTTPLTVEFPVSPDEVAFEFRLVNYRRKVKPMVVGGNTSVSVELERARLPTPPNKGAGSASKGSATGDGLMRPGD